MTRKTIVDMAEFRRRLAKGHKPGVAVRFAGDGKATPSADSRTVTFTFSDGSVDRYGDTINVRGWQLENYRANPIILFGHDAGSVENVIGRAHNVRVEGDALVGDIEFMEASANPTAEAVYQMVKGGFLKTVSVGFAPLEWSLSKDKSRPNGVDFKKQELLEVSIVPIPANPNALQQAKAAGIEVERLGFSREAPSISKKGLYEVSWLAELLASLSYLEDCVEWEAEYEGDGSTVPQRLTDALKALGKVLVDMTAEEVAELFAEEDDEPSIIVSGDAVEMGALTPAQRAFIIIARAVKKQKKAQPLSIDLELGAESQALLDRLERAGDALSRGIEAVEQKAGKAISAANGKTLRDAHEMICSGCDMIRGVADQAEMPDDPDDTETKNAAEREARLRKAKAKQRRVALTAA